MAKKQIDSHTYATKIINKHRYMICRNSKPDGKYWQGSICTEWTRVGVNTTAVLCNKCSLKLCGNPNISTGYKSSGKPRGWQFMKEFVDAEGNVFHKGIEQPKLKNTLPPTDISSDSNSKKRLTKQEKHELRDQLLQQILLTRGELVKSTLKRDINQGKTRLRKLERQLKKLK
jgi:hypothetical protein